MGIHTKRVLRVRDTVHANCCNSVRQLQKSMNPRVGERRQAPPPPFSRAVKPPRPPHSAQQGSQYNSLARHAASEIRLVDERTRQLLIYGGVVSRGLTRYHEVSRCLIELFRARPGFVRPIIGRHLTIPHAVCSEECPSRQ